MLEIKLIASFGGFAPCTIINKPINKYHCHAINSLQLNKFVFTKSSVGQTLVLPPKFVKNLILYKLKELIAWQFIGLRGQMGDLLV